jgi:hypothetical protein
MIQRLLSELKFHHIMNHRFTRRSNLELVRKIEEFKHKRNLQLARGNGTKGKYDFYIEALEWVLDGSSKDN